MDLNGRVIWITGLSGSGKTTLARALQERLSGSVLLDGDALRTVLGSEGCHYDITNRKKLALTYANLARLIVEQGFTVIVSTISLFHEVHAWNRNNLPGYIEVFLDIPEYVREARDPKGLYAAEKQGIVNDMAGKAIKAEFPLNPDITLDHTFTMEDGLNSILALVNRLS